MANNDDLDRLIDKYAWNALQIQQLRLAKKHNVSLEYFTPQYDWEQLREIRLALEDGLDPSFLLDKHINSDSMKHTREKVYESSGLLHEKAKYRKQRRIISLGIFIGVIICIAILGLWKKDYIISMIYDIELEMTTNRKTIGMSEVKDFHFIDLVDTYSRDCELTIPDDDISAPGEYNLKYTIKNKSKTLSKNVILIVKDDIKPIMKLKHHTITIDVGKGVDLYSNILSCTDNVDGDIKDRVKIKDGLNNKKEGKYDVIYTVFDTEGNQTIETVNVIVVKKKELKKNNSTSKKRTSKNQTSASSEASAKNKKFLFEIYGEASATMQVALNYGNSILDSGKAHKFECKPIMKDGVYIGYIVIFS